MAAAAAIPGTVDAGGPCEPRRDDVLADTTARRRGQRQAVWVQERRTVRIEWLPRSVGRPPEVVDRVTVGGAKREAVGVDTGQSRRMRAGIGRVDVATEVERVGLARPDKRCDSAAACKERE